MIYKVALQYQWCYIFGQWCYNLTITSLTVTSLMYFDVFQHLQITRHYGWCYRFGSHIYIINHIILSLHKMYCALHLKDMSVTSLTENEYTLPASYLSECEKSVPNKQKYSHVVLSWKSSICLQNEGTLRESLQGNN